SSPIALSPSAERCETIARPTKPDDPVTITFKARSPCRRIVAHKTRDMRRCGRDQSRLCSSDTIRSSCGGRFPMSRADASRVQFQPALGRWHSGDRVPADLLQTLLTSEASLIDRAPTLPRQGCVFGFALRSYK